MAADAPQSPERVRSTTRDGVTTLLMNNPKRLNGWTLDMIGAVRAGLEAAAADPAVKVVILTGADPYYSAGVKLSALKLAHPRTLHATIVQENQALFDMFINFDKPIIAAINGPAIGAVVTSATLCDAMIASEKATFNTPFAALGVAREGCSTVHLARVMGEAPAERMLGDEGWKPTAAEAHEVGLVDQVVPHGELLDAAHAMAQGWIAEGRARTFRGGSTQAELLAVNARESVAVADSFLSAPFLKGQFNFLWSKRKRGPAMVFLTAWLTHPAWSRLR